MLTSPRRYLSCTLAVVFSALALTALGAAPALAGPTVTVRVEGESSTLLAPKTVTLNAPEPVSGCPANSVAAAINLATEGHWDHGEANGGAGNFTETILGETHSFTHESDTWAEWVNGKWGGGICSDLLGEGGEVLMVADHEPEPFFAPTVLPLVVSEAPTAVGLGVPFQVKIDAIHTAPEAFAELGQGTPLPAEGVTVSGAGASATTAANGVATLTLGTAGLLTLRAAKTGDAPSAPFTICVHSGNDGTCGTTAPGTGAGTSAGAAPLPYKGSFALVAKIAGLTDGQVYGRASAPRVLGGTILSHSAVTAVSLELRRRHGRHCSAYDGRSERFRAARCGASTPFAAGNGSVFSYLLPSKLGPGRYVLDIHATDNAGNTLTLARGTSRIVFYVR
jgi:hypothetical protein